MILIFLPLATSSESTDTLFTAGRTCQVDINISAPGAGRETGESKMRIKTFRWALTLMAITTMLFGSMPAHAQQAKNTLDTVIARGSLRCSAHNGSFPGFFEIDPKGNWKGLDISMCRAVATAILGSPDKVTFVPLSWAQRFTGLKSGDIDVLFKATGWTLSRDTEQDINFSLPYFFGGFQFMVPASSKVTSAKQLSGATVCTSAGTSIEPVLATFMASIDTKFQIVTFEKDDEETDSYIKGRCDALAGWGPSLAVARATKLKSAPNQTILPITLTMEPEAAAVRQNDKRFLDVVNWTIAAMIHAEEVGLTSANVDSIRAKLKQSPSADPATAKFLGVTKGYGHELGLRDDFAYQVIKQVGNYGDVYDQTLGKDSAYKLPRGYNRLWKDGGMIYAPIFD
jgi:general L-amino acid transport system substrate-binding protein